MFCRPAPPVTLSVPPHTTVIGFDLKSETMKIAIYVPSWPPGFTPSGIVTYASYLVPALRKLGHEVFILAQQKMTEDDDPHIIDLQHFCPGRTLWQRTTYRIAPNAALFRAATDAIVSAVTKLIAEHGVDVFEIEESFGWSNAIIRRNLLPVVVRLHGPWFLNGRFEAKERGGASHRRRELLEGRAIESANYVTAPTAAVLDAVKKRYHLSLAASRVIYNPIRSVDESIRWRNDICTKNSFLFVGRFDKQKGGDLVLRAFAELGAVLPEASLIFVGPDKGISDSNGVSTSFEQFVHANIPESLRPRIKFCGSLNWTEAMSLRSHCCATIFSSRYEVAGYTLLEAMSLGCPIVAAAVGGVPEVIQNRHNGLLVSPEDASAIAAACYELAINRSLAERLGLQAWLDCQNLCNPDAIAVQTIDSYAEAIKEFELVSNKSQ